MPDTATLIETAETAAREDCESLEAEFRDLAAAAQRHEALCKRLSTVHPEALRIHRAMQTAVSHLEGPGRRPEPESGESRDEEHTAKVLEMRRGQG